MPINRESGKSGEVDDSISIQLGKDKPRIIERYSFHTSILQQPAAFNIVMSLGKLPARVLLDRYPPGPQTGCILSIGPNRQFTGELDAPNASGNAASTSVTLAGRDMMARLFNSDLDADRSFDSSTYEELVKAALQDVGLGGRLVSSSNDANRVIRAGQKVKVIAQASTTTEVRQTGSGPGFRSVITAKLGESWFDFLKRHLDKQGLFLWCDASGNFIVSRPNTDQAPMFHFYRKRGELRQANVKTFSFKNDTTRRVSEVVVFARGTGRKHGHNHTHGGFQDQEMVRLGFNKRKVFRDANVNSAEEAEFYARRRIAEINRGAWSLSYVISGHSAPIIGSRSPRDRAVVCPDVMARVDDDELGIHENMYIESVEYRSPPRESVVTLMRVQDMLFGESQAKKGAEIAKKPKVRQPISFERGNPELETLYRDFLIQAEAQKQQDRIVRGVKPTTFKPGK